MVTDVTPEDPLMSEEIFGPVLPIVTVDSVEEAAAFIKEREKPLSLYIFSQDRAVQDKMIASTSSGSVCCNDVMVQVSRRSLRFLTNFA